jgi:hypothetical protein
VSERVDDFTVVRDAFMFDTAENRDDAGEALKRIEARLAEAERLMYMAREQRDLQTDMHHWERDKAARYEKALREIVKIPNVYLGNQMQKLARAALADTPEQETP